MALSNRDRIGKSLDIFTEAYRPWVVLQLKSRHGEDGEKKGQELLEQSTRSGDRKPKGVGDWDVSNLLTVINGEWPYLFSKKLGQADRSMLHELQEVRNQWAHQKPFSTNDTQRAMDTIVRLLKAISAEEPVVEAEKLLGEVMRTRFAEMQRTASGRAKKEATKGNPREGLHPWREIVQPHPDVRNGTFTQAEFAADLAQVHRGDAHPEYGDPKEFFRRTYLTEGLSGLITNAIKRLNGNGGHPVVELQTNFGGGKTHSMLALYHLVGGTPAGSLSGIDALLQELGLPEIPETARSVLVGTAFSPGKPLTVDGLTINTIWGRMAYQLGGKDAYAIVSECDANKSAPGSDDLVELFKSVGPCLILIDEWVAYCRQTYETSDLPGGSFDQNMTFAQALTEAVKAAPQALLVASLPQSRIEVGGDGGQEALTILQNTFSRIEFNWRPATQDESYEIVRRRLFEPIDDPRLFAERDAVIRAFTDMYRQNRNEFPQQSYETVYDDRMELAYPIHPELFDRLYEDWSSMEEFQRTRGVLRLMAMVVHSLWSRNDSSLLILPGMVSIDDSEVQSELTRYLAPNWAVIIETNVDGPNSVPNRIDNEIGRFGQYWATRRVARTIYMGSAPVEDQANKGLDIRNVRLGCAQPGENVACFGDALRQLGNQATNLYADGSRYWFSTQPNVLSLAKDNAVRFGEIELQNEIHQRLKETPVASGTFAGVHAAPESSSDVPDDCDARLVILPVSKPHVANDESSTAVTASIEYLEKRGNAPRLNRNTLVFLAVDKAKLDELMKAVAIFLAWKGIWEHRERLNLDPHNTAMAKSKKEESEKGVNVRIPEAFQWLISPTQDDPTDKVAFPLSRLSGGDGLVDRVWTKLERGGEIVKEIAGTVLRMYMDRHLWKDQDHLDVRSLADYFAQYPYLPRLARRDAILEAIREGASSTVWDPETFAYAERYDEGKYYGLTAGRMPTVRDDGHSVIVKPEVAKPLLEKPAEGGASVGGEPDEGTKQVDGALVAPELKGKGDTTTPPSLPKRFNGEISLPAASAGMKFSDIMQEVVQHFSSDPDNEVTIQVEVVAKSPSGFDENVQRATRENSNTLGFHRAEFEEE